MIVGIGQFVAVLSLNLTLSLVRDYGVVYKTLPITNVTASTPIVVTSVGHSIPKGRLIHGIVDGVGGVTEANGLWVLTPIDADTFYLTTFDAQGELVLSEGTGVYTDGGQIQWAFPDGQILLGRRNKMLATNVSTPRIVMIPTRGRAWDIEPYGGAAPDDLAPVHGRGSKQRQAMRKQPTLGTRHTTFEVFINGAGPDYGEDLDPDFNDFNATQALSDAFFVQLFDMLGHVEVLTESWPSQEEGQGSVTQRGQQWRGILSVPFPINTVPIPFAPIGTSGSIIVQPVDPLVPDDQTLIDFGG